MQRCEMKDEEDGKMRGQQWRVHEDARAYIERWKSGAVECAPATHQVKIAQRQHSACRNRSDDSITSFMSQHSIFALSSPLFHIVVAIHQLIIIDSYNDVRHC